MTNLDSILKSRDITLPTKVRLVKAMVFPVVMYGCESWTIRKSEHQKIDAFELWCWRRFERVPWTARRSSQSILKEISPEYSLVGLMLKLKLQYFDHLMQRTDSLEKTQMLGKIEGKRRRRWQKMRWLDSIMDSIDTWIWANSGRWWRKLSAEELMLLNCGIGKDSFSSAQSLSCVWLFVTPWTVAHQASLSITNSQSLLKLMPI